MLYPLSYIVGALDGNRTRDLRIQIRRSTSELQARFPDAGGHRYTQSQSETRQARQELDPLVCGQKVAGSGDLLKASTAGKS